jgi:hypothetical protein
MARRNGNKRSREKQKRMKTKIYDLLPSDLQKIAEEMGFKREKRNHPHNPKNRRGRWDHNNGANSRQRNGRDSKK